jgi:DNA processing protein
VLFSDLEFAQLVDPLITEEPASREETVALVTFSHLCEPSDLLPGLIQQSLPMDQLLQEIIERSDATRMLAKLGEDSVQDIESELRAPFAEIWGRALERWLPRLSKSSVLESLRWMGDTSGRGRRTLVPQGSVDYPMAFEDLRFHKPFVLWVWGNERLLSSEQAVSIVGTRQASQYGTDVTRDLAAVAAMHGLTTVSGGAFGIDSIVHESANLLEAPTIAFMAGGLAKLYPQGKRQMLLDVVCNGALVSECAPDVQPAKWRFLMRNRLIAALGQGTVVVEAGKTSGALNTAGAAINLGRQVAIVPGVIGSPRSAGGHDLLNNNLGAVRLLARPQELLELVGLSPADPVQLASLGALEKRSLDAFGFHPLETWEIQRLAGLTVRECQIALGSLESQGLVERTGTGYRRT